MPVHRTRQELLGEMSPSVISSERSSQTNLLMKVTMFTSVFAFCGCSCQVMSVVSL